MSKFTPGTWDAEPCTANGYEGISYFEIKSSSRDNQIADVHVGAGQKPVTLEEAEANAALISCAPQLLEGCMLSQELFVALMPAFETAEPMLHSQLKRMALTLGKLIAKTERKL